MMMCNSCGRFCWAMIKIREEIDDISEGRVSVEQRYKENRLQKKAPPRSIVVEYHYLVIIVCLASALGACLACLSQRVGVQSAWTYT